MAAPTSLPRYSDRSAVSGSGQVSPVSQVPAPMRNTCTFGIGFQSSGLSSSQRSNQAAKISSYPKLVSPTGRSPSLASFDVRVIRQCPVGAMTRYWSG